MGKTYAEWAEYLSHGRDKTDRPLEGKTTRIRRVADDAVALRYHQTDVITWYEDGRIVLDSGGWHTSTTKQKMGYAVVVIQTRGVWTLRWHGVTYVYEDGITLYPDGRVEGAGDTDESDKLRKLLGQVNRYVSGYMDALLAGDVPPPSAGDCWYCMMRVSGTGVPLGESNGNTEHLKMHMKEKYYVPSLLHRAVEVSAPSPMALHILGYLWKTHEASDMPHYHDLARDQLGASLRKYMRRQLGLPS